MVKRIFALLLVLVMIAGCGIADELPLRDSTPGQKMLKNYMSRVNDFLVENGDYEINRVFDETDNVVELGISSAPDNPEPEVVGVTVYMRYDGIHYMLVRVSDVNRFPRVAGAFIRALSPDTITKEQAMATPAERAQRVVSNPSDSFVDYEFDKYEDKEKEILNGEKPQVTYAYYPNQYQTHKDWLQMMIIFPLPEYWDQDEGIIMKVETTDPPFDEEGEGGYFPDNRLVTLEANATPTPEPDSAAMEYDAWAPD